MTMDSGIGLYPGAPGARAMDLAIRVAFPILLAISAWTFTQLWTHEGRLTAIERDWVHVADDLGEIKADVKKLLGNNK